MTTPHTTPEHDGQGLPKGFLSDVMTAAGLVTHGNQCKALGDRLAASVMAIRAATQTAKAAPVEGVSESKALCSVCGGSRHVAAHRLLLSGPHAGEPLDHAFTIDTESPQPLAPPDTGNVGAVKKRATELHEKASMPWEQALDLALSEQGISLPLYQAINKLVCQIGYEGSIDSDHALVTEVMDALHDLDGGAMLCPECKGQGGGEGWIKNENDRSGQSDYRAWVDCSLCNPNTPAAALPPGRGMVPMTVPIPHEEDVEGHLLYEVRCDAARWNTLPAFLEKYQIDYVGLKQDIDAVLAGNCCEPDLCETQSECDSLGCRIERASLVGLGQSDGIAADIDKGIPVAAAGAPEEAPSVVNLGGDGSEHDFKAAASALPHDGDSSATHKDDCRYWKSGDFCTCQSGGESGD